MDFNQIAVFVKVVQAGSFSAAARLLGIPVSTVSNRIAMLEKRLGVTLLQRTTRKLSLTDAGKKYFDQASKGVASIFNAESYVADDKKEPCGFLKVSAPYDIGDSLFKSIVYEMNYLYPEVKLEFVLTKEYVDLVADGVDVAIRTGDLNDSSLVAKLAGKAEWKLFASPIYLDSNDKIFVPQDIRHHRCLPFTPFGKKAWLLNNSDSTLTVPLNNTIISDDIRLITAMTLDGKGISLLPDYQCNLFCDNGDLVNILPGWYAKKDPINIIYPKHRYISKKLRVFVDIAYKHLQAILSNK